MTAKKLKPWRGEEYLTSFLSLSVREAASAKRNCTVIPDGCDPMPAAVKRLIKLVEKNYDEHCECTYCHWLRTYRKSTAKRGKGK